MPLSFAMRAPQIYTNYTNGHTGTSPPSLPPSLLEYYLLERENCAQHSPLPPSLPPSPGQLAALTVLMAVAGSLARVFTTLKGLGSHDPELKVFYNPLF